MSEKDVNETSKGVCGEWTEEDSIGESFYRQRCQRCLNGSLGSNEMNLDQSNNQKHQIRSKPTHVSLQKIER
jgi:hypothetical protein